MGSRACLSGRRSTRFAGVRVRARALTFGVRQTQLRFPSMPVREAVIKSRVLFSVATLKEGQKRDPVISSPNSSLGS